jgi:hypothetical protein
VPAGLTRDGKVKLFAEGVRDDLAALKIVFHVWIPLSLYSVPEGPAPGAKKPAKWWDSNYLCILLAVLGVNPLPIHLAG